MTAGRGGMRRRKGHPRVLNRVHGAKEGRNNRGKPALKVTAFYTKRNINQDLHLWVCFIEPFRFRASCGALFFRAARSCRMPEQRRKGRPRALRGTVERGGLPWGCFCGGLVLYPDICSRNRASCLIFFVVCSVFSTRGARHAKKCSIFRLLRSCLGRRFPPGLGPGRHARRSAGI